MLTSNASSGSNDDVEDSFKRVLLPALCLDRPIHRCYDGVAPKGEGGRSISAVEMGESSLGWLGSGHVDKTTKIRSLLALFLLQRCFDGLGVCMSARGMRCYCVHLECKISS